MVCVNWNVKNRFGNGGREREAKGKQKKGYGIRTETPEFLFAASSPGSILYFGSSDKRCRRSFLDFVHLKDKFDGALNCFAGLDWIPAKRRMFLTPKEDKKSSCAMEPRAFKLVGSSKVHHHHLLFDLSTIFAKSPDCPCLKYQQGNVLPHI
jgi:hypothetical protein